VTRIVLDESVPLGQIQVRVNGKVISTTHVDTDDATKVAESILRRMIKDLDTQMSQDDLKKGAS
jgi:hypothetical protein